MPTPPGYAECSYQLTQAGLNRPAYVTFGVDPTETDPTLIAADLFNCWDFAGSLKTITDNSVTLTGVRVSVGTDGGGDLVYVLDTSSAGTSSGLSSLPPNCAVLIRKTSTLGGRRGRGRMYYPWCVSETNVDEAGIVAPAQVTAINAAFSVWRSRLTATNNPLVLLHSAGKTPVPAPSPVTALITDKLLATQRRRLGR